MTYGPPSLCFSCKHLRKGEDGEDYKCDAFPEGIPEEILSGLFRHDKPYPGDNGIRYAKDKSSPFLRENQK